MLITLPDLCYSENMGELVILKKGDMGYYPFTPTQEMIELGSRGCNNKIGVTSKMESAMTICSMSGWRSPLGEKEFEVTEEQAKKQTLIHNLLEKYNEVAEESTDIKRMEHSLQKVIEDLYPEHEWWETTHHYPLFNELLSGKGIKQIVLEIVASID